MPPRKPKQGVRRCLTAAAVAVSLAIVAASCSEESEAPAADAGIPSERLAQAANILTVIPRSEVPIAADEPQADRAERPTLRELGPLLRMSPVDSPPSGPTFRDPAYEHNVEAVYPEHLAADLGEAEHICAPLPDYHCLVAVVTYEPCEAGGGCVRERVLEVTLVKTFGDWRGVLIENFHPSLDRRTMDDYVDRALSLLGTSTGVAFDQVHSRISEERPERALALFSLLEEALSFYITEARAADSGEEAGFRIGTQTLLETILSVYDAAVASITPEPEVFLA